MAVASRIWCSTRFTAFWASASEAEVTTTATMLVGWSSTATGMAVTA